MHSLRFKKKTSLFCTLHFKGLRFSLSNLVDAHWERITKQKVSKHYLKDVAHLGKQSKQLAVLCLKRKINIKITYLD